VLVSPIPRSCRWAGSRPYSDGVFAIAITLLVLELGVSATAEDDLAGGIIAQWPAYLAYITSFLTIGAMWLRHSTVTRVLRAGDVTLYRINLVVLLLASFLPMIGRSPALVMVVIAATAVTVGGRMAVASSMASPAVHVPAGASVHQIGLLPDASWFAVTDAVAGLDHGQTVHVC
jgi:hypothetical protein